MPCLWRIRPTLFFFCLTALTPAVLAQSHPFVTNTPSIGSVVINGTGTPTADIYVCVNNAFPTATPLCGPGDPGASLQKATTKVLANNTFSATLNSPLAAGEYVYVTQVAGAAAHEASVAVQAVGANAKPIIIGSLSAGSVTVQGTGSPGSSIFVCVKDQAPASPPQDCSEGTMAPLANPVAGAPNISSVAVSPAGAITATLTAPLTGGNFVYLAQTIAGNPTTFSQPVTVAASTAPLSILGPLIGGATTITGSGNVHGKIFICVSASAPTGSPADCSAKGALPITGGAGPSWVQPVPSNAADSAGSFVANFLPGLTAGSSVYLTQIIPNNPVTFSPVMTVQPVVHEREHTDFVGGTLLSANGSNYSQGNIFLALNYDRALYRPGDYSGHPHWHPGLNFFFQGRLTTIPVNASQTVTMPTTAGSTATTTTPTVSSFLAAQKAAQFGGGGYVPIMFARSPHPLFEPVTLRNSTFYFGPMARFGFSTPSGSLSGSSSTSSSAGTTTTTTTALGTTSSASGQLYNYWLIGGRIATADIEPGSLHTRHYFDVGIGKYSNLQSLVCNPKKAPLSPAADPKCLTLLPSAPTDTTNCTTPTQNGTSYYMCPPVNPAYESRTMLYRLAFEGYLEVPSTSSTSFILGMSANTAMVAFSRRANLDPNNKAPEDIEFLIAYKFDITKLFSAAKLIGQ